MLPENGYEYANEGDRKPHRSSERFPVAMSMKSTDMKLDISAVCFPHLAALAEDWLTSGATTFSLWSAKQPLATWPPNVIPDGPPLVAPIQIGRQVVGELHVTGVDTHAQRRLDAEAHLFAQIVRLDDELHQMTSELIEVQDQILALYDLTQSTRSHLEISETLRSIATEAARLLRAEGAVMVLSPIMSWNPTPFIDEYTLQRYFHIVQASGSELVLCADEDTAIAPGVHSACFIPIRIRNTHSAMLGVFNNHGRSFHAPDLKLARTIAEHAGVQLERALLYQEMLTQTRLQTEMELARDVQTLLLPQQRPQIVGIDIDAESRPALHVGGDFYNFVRRDDGSLVLMLGDVAGKGMSAAFIMGIIHTIAHIASRLSQPPATILSRVNADLYDTFTTLDSFATAFFAQYYPNEQRLVYTNAGHAPVIFCPAGGPARLLDADGVPIGVLPLSLNRDEQIMFGADDILVVATDGFNEACHASGEMFGYERLLRLTETVADQPVHAIVRAFYDAVETFAEGRPRDDDQTIIVMKGNAIAASSPSTCTLT